MTRHEHGPLVGILRCAVLQAKKKVNDSDGEGSDDEIDDEDDDLSDWDEVRAYAVNC